MEDNVSDNLKNKTVLVYDNGLFVDLARTLARSFGRVLYHCPWESGFPKMNIGRLGQGISEIELCASPWAEFDAIDLWVFPDVGAGPLQDWLRDQGRRVWGSGSGENLELDRVNTKKLLARADLPVGPYAVVKGITALREFLKAHKKQIVKLSKWRGHMETFRADDYRTIEPVLDKLEYELGPGFKETTSFLVEEALEHKVEVGIDGYCVDGEFPKHILTGIEIKDLGYVGALAAYADMPDCATAFSKAMGPLCKRGQYRGFWSDETRADNPDSGYMIDACMRMASPPGEVYQELYENLAEIIWHGAGGVMVEPKASAKYCAEILIHSTWANADWQPIDFPASNGRWVKLRNCCKIGKQWYIIPQSVPMGEIGAVVGLGNTMKAACAMAHEIAQSVSGYSIDIPEGAIEEAQAQIAEAKSMGINLLGGK